TGTVDGIAILRVFSGLDGSELAVALPFGLTPVGINVAAGDLDGDRAADVVVGASSAVPLVAAYSGHGLAPLLAFLAFPGYAGGVTVAAGDLDGDRRADIVV